MFRRFFRWILRIVIVVVVLFAIVVVSDYISHRVQPNSVLAIELDGTVVERGSTSVLGLLSKDETALNDLRNLAPEMIRNQRRQKFLDIGRKPF